MINKTVLSQLISGGETSLVDFKREYHKCLAELVKDILCLANADGPGERYCIYGVDNKHEPVGVTDKWGYATEEQICDILLKAKLNNLPEIKLEKVNLNDKEIGVLVIKNIPKKPFFITEDYKCDKQKHAKHKGEGAKDLIVLASTIYTRFGSNNCKATELQMYKMWEERFGLNLDPLARIKIYLEDIDGWKTSCDFSDNLNGVFYTKFPEFTLAWYDSMEPHEKFYEFWHLEKTNRVGRYELGIRRVALKYHQTVLHVVDLINVEHKKFFPVPKYNHLGEACICTSTIEFKIATIVDTEIENRMHYARNLKGFLSTNSEFEITISETLA